jgi:hypothetical protein
MTSERLLYCSVLLCEHKRLKEEWLGCSTVVLRSLLFPPANRQNLSHRVELTDYGNPDYLPVIAQGKQAVM